MKGLAAFFEKNQALIIEGVIAVVGALAGLAIAKAVDNGFQGSDSAEAIEEVATEAAEV